MDIRTKRDFAVKNVFDIYEFENTETAEETAKDFYIDGRVVKLINLEEIWKIV